MKTFKLLTVLLIAGLVALASSANAARQTRTVSNFHGISVSAGIDLYLSQKGTEEVVIDADSEDIDKIITEVEGGILKIYIKEKSWFNFNFNSKPRKAYVSFKEIDKLDASAGSDVVSETTLKLKDLKLDASSGSDVKLELEADQVRVGSSSGSDIVLKGHVNSIKADASSGSDIDAGELQAKKANANASSGSDIKLYVTEQISASASSGADIHYSGNPGQKDINESSGGDVSGR
jgi:hypothetical protein